MFCAERDALRKTLSVEMRLTRINLARNITYRVTSVIVTVAAILD
jgi:hypothetical protein